MSAPSSFTVNGAVRSLAVEGDETLLSVLRDRLGLTGAKRGCNQGVCGACTVLVDDRPVRACLSLAANCAGARVVTVEAFERDALGRRLQQAIAESGAVQCGFCTAGMLISAYGLLAANPDPGIADIRDGLSGNLCRCSGYRKLVDAVLQVAAELRS